MKIIKIDYAIIKVYKEHVLPYLSTFVDSEVFRVTKLHTEDCELVIQKYMQPLKDIFEHYSGR